MLGMRLLALVGFCGLLVAAEGGPQVTVTIADGQRLQQHFRNSPLAEHWQRFLTSDLASEWTRLAMRSQEQFGASPGDLLAGIHSAQARFALDGDLPRLDLRFHEDDELRHRVWGALLQRMDAKLDGGATPAIAMGDWAIGLSGHELMALPLWAWDAQVAPEAVAPNTADISLGLELKQHALLPPGLTDLQLQIGLQLEATGSRTSGTLAAPQLPLQPVDRRALERLPRGVLAVLAIGLTATDQGGVAAQGYTAAQKALAELGIVLPDGGMPAIDGTVMALTSFGGYLPALTVSLPDAPDMEALIQQAFKDDLDLERARKRTTTVMLPGPTPLWIRHYEDRWYFSRDQVVLTHLCGRNLLPPSPLLKQLGEQAGQVFAAVDTQNLAGLLLSDLPLKMGELPAAEQARLRRWQRGLRPLVEELPPLSIRLWADAAAGNWQLKADNVVLPIILAGIAHSWWERLESLRLQQRGERWMRVLLDAVDRWRENNPEGGWPQATDLSVLHGERALDDLASTIYLQPPSSMALDDTLLAVDDPSRLEGKACLLLYADGTIARVEGLQLWHQARRLARAQATGSDTTTAWQQLRIKTLPAYQAAQTVEP